MQQPRERERKSREREGPAGTVRDSDAESGGSPSPPDPVQQVTPVDFGGGSGGAAAACPAEDPAPAAPPCGVGGQRNPIRLGAAALSPHSLRSAARDPSPVGQHHLALRPGLWSLRAAVGWPPERPVHQPVRSPAAIHPRWRRLHHRRRSDHRIRRRHRLAHWRHREFPTGGDNRLRDRVLDPRRGEQRDSGSVQSSAR